MENKEVPLWEVFVQCGAQKPYEHAGSVHATDGELALHHARDYRDVGCTK